MIEVETDRQTNNRRDRQMERHHQIWKGRRERLRERRGRQKNGERL